MADGPEPYEAYVSAVCDMLTCPIDVAEQQDVSLVTAVANYRAARRAQELWEEDPDTLSEHPALKFWSDVLSFGEEAAVQIAIEQAVG